MARRAAIKNRRKRKRNHFYIQRGKIKKYFILPCSSDLFISEKMILYCPRAK